MKHDGLEFHNIVELVEVEGGEGAADSEGA